VELINAQIRKKRVMVDYPELIQQKALNDEVSANKVEVKNERAANREPICKNCQKSGHIRRFCPVIVCSKCQKKGHLARDCTLYAAVAAKSEGPREPDRKVIQFGRSTKVQAVEFGEEIAILNADYTMVQNLIEILDNKNNWLQVSGSLDSGAGRTVGPIEALRKYCGTIHKLHKPMRIRLPNDDFVFCENKGSIVLRFIVDDNGPIYSGQVTVFLLPKPWADFLVGREVLRRLDALPEQTLARIPKDMRTKFLGK
jgi:Zinc knuckle